MRNFLRCVEVRTQAYFSFYDYCLSKYMVLLYVLMPINENHERHSMWNWNIMLSAVALLMSDCETVPFFTVKIMMPCDIEMLSIACVLSTTAFANKLQCSLLNRTGQCALKYGTSCLTVCIFSWFWDREVERVLFHTWENLVSAAMQEYE